MGRDYHPRIEYVPARLSRLHPPVTTERSIPLLAALAVAALCFFMCIWVDGGAVAATSREADGATRGTIVDRNDSYSFAPNFTKIAY